MEPRLSTLNKQSQAKFGFYEDYNISIMILCIIIMINSTINWVGKKDMPHKNAFYTYGFLLIASAL